MFRYRRTRIVTITELEFSVIPLVIILLIGWGIYKGRGEIMGFMESLLIWIAVIVGPCMLGFIGLMIYSARIRQLEYRSRPARALSTKQDIPVIKYVINPEPVAEIEDKAGQGVTINGLTIEEWQRQNRS